MADKLMRAQVIFQRLTDDPQDIVTNTWHFDGEDPGGAGVFSDTDYHNAVVAALNGFYTSCASIFSDLIKDNPQVRIYDLRDPSAPGAPRLPEFIGNLTVDIPAIGADFRLVEEAAVCLSFAAEPGSGLHPRRRRGRIFLGPLRSSVTEVVSGRLRVKAATRTQIAAAATELANGISISGGSEQLKWAIYSRRTDELGATLDDSFHDVVSGWIDDAFDTQRSRGPAPTGRTTFTD